MGESAKRNNINADTIESSDDEKELFGMLLESACNELVSSVALRFETASHKITPEYISITFTTDNNARQGVLPLLRQAIVDYLVNEITLQWLLLRSPQMANSYISLRTTLYNNVQQQFAKFSNLRKVRRRPTDLAGI
jgi:hypothetical protein